ncbi:hypothetical protein FHS79_001857 [Polymorphobacter multimanifer]|uniref:DUF2125 domain-containing protein n=1 Tax=Polymorphobacter multimanifer TaxID=1070431 RepID=A0A841LFC8_9SPHN|nr:hypothetical protein [Polymorphobacter multimanifer]MBB6227678.1 hypothetical protein [Polymorphobacter multimanifer]
MKRRVPLWLTLVPLLAAGGLYFLLWRGWAGEFEAELAQWLPEESLAIGGFPYRLEATVAGPAVQIGETITLRVSAAAARINRGPWQRELTVVRLEAPQASATVSPAIRASITARSATASINWGEGRLRRQSTIFQAARFRLGSNPLPITADTLEMHLRERAETAVPPSSPTFAPRGQLVLAGTRLRLAGGDALTMAAEVLATGAARLTDYDRWARGGTLEITRLSLSDGHGEVVSASGTLVPQQRDGLQLAGTLTTVCPYAVAAAFAGTVPAPEKRLRVPVRLAFSGAYEAPVLAPFPDLSRRPRREQQPDCPRLR